MPSGGLPSVGLPVPAPVVRGVGIAAAAAVAVSGAAAALAGATGSAPPDTDSPATGVSAGNAAAALLVPPPSLVAAQSLTVPGPGAGVLDGALLDGQVLDTAGLSRAVARAQGQARRLADDARTAGDVDGRVAGTDRADEDRDEEVRADGEDTDEDSDERAEEEQAKERAERVGRIADPGPDRAASPSGRDCGLDTGGLGAVKSHVRTAAEILGCAFGKPEVLGIAGRGGPSDHPGGRALDFMVDRPTGDALAACAVRHRDALGISYVIWRQRIDTGSGFRAMEDRGGATANHFDHVHVSFDPRAGSGGPVEC